MIQNITGQQQRERGATVHARNFTGHQPRLAMPQVVVQCVVQCALIFQIRSNRI
jgi:hypothetical protein